MLTIDSSEVIVIAGFLGCEPGIGLVDTMNALSKRKNWNPATTYGDIYCDVLEHFAAEHKRIRKQYGRE